MADDTSLNQNEQESIKVPKKLVIIDANESSEEPTQKITKSITVKSDDSDAAGDTPPVTNDDELAALSAAIENVDIPVAAKEPSVDVSEPKAITIADAIEAAGTNEEVENIDAATEAPEEVLTDTVAEEEPLTDVEVAVEPVVEEELPLKGALADEKTFSDAKTAEAIKDIVAKESDEVLAHEDAVNEFVPRPKKQHRIKDLFANWWKNPATKWGTIVGVFCVVIIIGLLPASRYALLNAAGVRVSSSIVINSSDSDRPLKNVDVTIGDQQVKTDDKGVASFTKLKLGKTTLKVAKRGYAEVEQSRVLGWGSNPLGQIGLVAKGTQFTFVVKDFLSDKVITNAEATSGDFNAQADKDGKITLSIDQSVDKDLVVTIKSAEYRDEQVTVKLTDTAEKPIKLVPAKKHVFVSKRTGKLDVYKIDADGKNEEKLIAATGSERDDLALLPHPTTDYSAFVSTRDGKRNSGGYLMSTLNLLDNKTGQLTKIIESERIQLVDWTGDRIVYIAVTQGASAANPARSKLFSFEIGQPGPKEIASANYFNDAVVFKGAIYYAPSSYAIPVSSVKFYRVNPDGSNLATLFDKEVWNIYRSDFDTLYLSIQQDWYELKAGGTPTKLAAAPTSPRSRLYRDSPDKKKSLWVDSRDGKGVLIAYNSDTKKDDVIQTQSGLVSPAYWLSSNTVVYRISDGREVADYVKNIDGGDAKKLRDVTNTDSANYFN